MEPTNPYRTPSADVAAPRAQGLDHTRPFDPSGRFGRLSYIAWVMLVSVTLNVVQFVLGIGLGLAGGASPEQSGFIAIAIGIGLILLALLAMIGLLIAASMSPELMQQWQQALQAT